MSRVRKAIAGGITGAVAAAGTFAITGDNPQDWLVQFGLALAGGFALGFIGVWIAPANEIPAVRR